MKRVTAQLFADALSGLELKGKQKEFLRAHYEAPHRALTVTMMAKEVGYKRYGGINRHYGGLAKKLGDKLGIKTRPEDDYLSLLCEFVKPNKLTNSECMLIMRPEFAEGLRLARWV